MWEIAYEGTRDSPAIAYAPDQDLIFAGTYPATGEVGGEIYVVRGSTGTVIDTILIGLWSINGKPLTNIESISCSSDGSLLCICAGNGNSESGRSVGGKVFVLEYPSRRIVIDSIIYNDEGSWKGVRGFISPTGRYVVVPFWSVTSVSMLRVIDRQSDTSFYLANSRYGDFDDNERYLAFSTIGEVNKYPVSNQVAIVDLSNLSKPPKRYNEYGTPSLSSNGRFLMIGGFGAYPAEYSRYHYHASRATVTDLETDSIIWALGEKKYLGVDPFPKLDFMGCTWSEDASKVFLYGIDLEDVSDWSTRSFYRVGDTVSNSRMCDSCHYCGTVSGGRGQDGLIGSVANPQLTIGYTNGGIIRPIGAGLTAEALSHTTSTTVSNLLESHDLTFPNPVKGDLHIRCIHVSTATHWILTSINGERIAEGLVVNNPTQYDNEIAITLPPNLAIGVYNVRLIDSRLTSQCSYVVMKQ